MREYDTAEISGRKFGILLDDETMTAYEAIWTGNGWETDFSYPALGINSFDVAGALDFEAVKKWDIPLLNSKTLSLEKRLYFFILTYHK